jgi:hypothetical protein
MRAGYVAFLRVLGFSALVSGDRADRIEGYLQCLKDVFGDVAAQPVKYIVFSNGIILTTDDAELPSLHALIARCSVLLAAMVSHDIALRGAIAHGSYITENTESGTFVAGKAIVEACQFEAAQDWVGIMLAPSIAQAVPDLFTRSRYADPINSALMSDLIQRLDWAAFVRPCRVPFHPTEAKANEHEEFAIIPSYGIAEFGALRDCAAAALDRMAGLKSVAPTPSAKAKYSRSIFWLSQVRSEWSMAAMRVETAEVKRAGPEQQRIHEFPVPSM